MKNKKDLNLKRIKKNIRGITLIALVVTIIIVLILAGVALSLTVGDNGLFRRAQNAADTWQMAERNEQSEMEQAGDFIDDYANNISKRVDGVPIPKGFYYVGGEKDSGIIISDSPDDENKGVDYPTSSFKGNQFVWVPVEHPENYFTNTTEPEGVPLNGVETTTNVYSNLTIRSGDSYTVGAPNETTKVREPDLVSYDLDTSDSAQYYAILGFNSPTAMSESFVAEYKAMSDSIKKYKGFYIGRYELTGTVEEPTEKTGKVLTAASSEAENWYNLYKACKKVVTGKDNVKSTMIYGVQWDAVCDWLEQSGFNTDTDSSSWGNYNDSSGNADVEGAGLVQNTGYSDYWKANNIYDLAGNYYEWTQEANSTTFRIGRGGYYYNSGSSNPASDRGNDIPDNSNSGNSSRATLYIM